MKLNSDPYRTLVDKHVDTRDWQATEAVGLNPASEFPMPVLRTTVESPQELPEQPQITPALYGGARTNPLAGLIPEPPRT